MNCKHLEFTLLSDPTVRSTKKAEFLADPNNKQLANIFSNQKYKNGLSMTFSECRIPNMYMVMVKGNNDNLLIKLGHECGFPR